MGSALKENVFAMKDLKAMTVQFHRRKLKMWIHVWMTVMEMEYVIKENAYVEMGSLGITVRLKFALINAQIEESALKENANVTLDLKA